MAIPWPLLPYLWAKTGDVLRIEQAVVRQHPDRPCRAQGVTTGLACFIRDDVLRKLEVPGVQVKAEVTTPEDATDAVIFAELSSLSLAHRVATSVEEVARIFSQHVGGYRRGAPVNVVNCCCDWRA